MKGEDTILIVDDEANMRRVLSALLRREGFKTLEAADGEAALDVLKDQVVDAVLTDLKMPHMNGLELLAESHKQAPGVPVILLTAHGTVGSAVEALKQGAFDFLTKPFEPDDVRQVVAKTDFAVLVRGEDRFGHFQQVPSPVGDMTDDATAWHHRILTAQNEAMYDGAQPNA